MPTKTKKTAAAAPAPQSSSKDTDDVSMTDAAAVSSPAPAPEEEPDWLSEAQSIKIVRIPSFCFMFDKIAKRRTAPWLLGLCGEF